MYEKNVRIKVHASILFTPFFSQNKTATSRIDRDAYQQILHPDHPWFPLMQCKLYALKAVKHIYKTTNINMRRIEKNVSKSLERRMLVGVTF